MAILRSKFSPGEIIGKNTISIVYEKTHSTLTLSIKISFAGKHLNFVGAFTLSQKDLSY